MSSPSASKELLRDDSAELKRFTKIIEALHILLRKRAAGRSLIRTSMRIRPSACKLLRASWTGDLPLPRCLIEKLLSYLVSLVKVLTKEVSLDALVCESPQVFGSLNFHYRLHHGLLYSVVAAMQDMKYQLLT